MKVKPGFKQTEVGVVPVEWDAASIGQFSTCFSGGTPSTSNPRYYGGDIPWITSSDLNRRRVSEVAGRITDAGLVNSAAKFVTEGTLLIALYGATAGACAVSEIRAAINQAVLAIVPHGVITEFLFHTLTLRKDHFIKAYTQGGQPNLSGEIVKSFSIPIPPLPEQHVIAATLSDVDALLDRLDRLIAKKRDLKQAAMQQLLTGQTRLPGFQGEWEVKHLGDVGTFLKGSGVKKDEAESGDLPCIRYGEIYTHHNCYIRTCKSWISRDVAATATRLRQGDLLFAGSGETKEEIGKCVAFVNDYEAFAGGDIVILRVANADAMFMGYYCNTAPINAQKASMGQGDAVVHISAAALSRIEITVPSALEQTAIAAVLADMDDELAGLEARRDKTRDLKHGMMQELLTGRIRLI